MNACDSFKCPVCSSHYFGSIFESNIHVGRYCKGWPNGFDRGYTPCKENYEERFDAMPQVQVRGEAVPDDAKLDAQVKEWTNAGGFFYRFNGVDHACMPVDNWRATAKRNDSEPV